MHGDIDSVLTELQYVEIYSKRRPHLREVEAVSLPSSETKSLFSLPINGRILANHTNAHRWLGRSQPHVQHRHQEMPRVHADG